MRCIRIAAGVGLLCALVAPAAQPVSGEDEQAMRRFIDALGILDQNAADPVNLDQGFYQGAIPGMLRHLDPHSVFFDEGQFQQLQQMESSTRKGFGSVVSVLPGRVVVLQTLPNTPSAKAGMSPGDEIVAVNNYRLDRLEPDQIVELLTESKQKPAQLVVHRPGNARLVDLTLIPEAMQSSSVERKVRCSAYPASAISGFRLSKTRHRGRSTTGLSNRVARLEGAGARFAQQPGRPADGSAGNGFVFSEKRPGDPVREGPECAGIDREGTGRQLAVYLSAGDFGERQDGQRLGNCLRRDAGS